ncbi:MAG: TerD family protein [Aureispira sp.]
MLPTIALNRMNIILYPLGRGLTSRQKMAVVAELANLGYRLENPARLQEVDASFLDTFPSTLQLLAKKRGAEVQYVPLFNNFPEQTPADEDYLNKRFYGFLANVLQDTKNNVRLDNGVLVPRWLFDLDEFGADPITQTQSLELWEKAAAVQQEKKEDGHVEWITLELVAATNLEAMLQGYLQQLLYAKASIPEYLHVDIRSLLSHFGMTSVDASKVVFKETKAWLGRYCWEQKDWEGFTALHQTATDVLRSLAAITDSDVSLSQPIKFPSLPRPARRAILTVLERSSGTAENLLQYKGLWLALGRYLHPGAQANRFPRTAEVFDQLRNGKLITFEGHTEQLLAANALLPVLEHLVKRPGVFLRRLHELLRRFQANYVTILKYLAPSIEAVTLKNLLVLESYFEHINDAKYRSVVNKKGKMIVLDNNSYKTLAPEVVAAVLSLLRDGIQQQLAVRESWAEEKVWIDPNLVHYTLPLQQRKSSEGLLTLGRGSRVAVDLSKVLRLFVYWKQVAIRTDLDLSIALYNADFKLINQVSYTNLSAMGAVHSGDLQDGLLGAAEFIDIDLKKVSKATAYVSVQIYRYAGESFAQMACHAGWMWREKVNSNYKSFDIKTVANKLDLNGVGSYSIPFMVDIAQEQIIYTDLYVNGLNKRNAIETSVHSLEITASELAQFTQQRPTFFQLAKVHALARQASLVETAEEASITFGTSKAHTYNILQTEQVLSELI